MNIDNDKLLNLIKEEESPYIYLVGGYIRDMLLGKKTFDRDIVVENPEAFAKNLANKLNAAFITLDNENEIYRVVLEDKTNFFDITKPVGGNIEQDLTRRDFTINAIAYDLKKNEFIDTVGGLKDIDRRLIRQIRKENFQDDPLRILRAFRFMSTTGFEIEQSTLNSMTEYRNLYKKPTIERILYEIMKLFGGENISKTLLLMDDMDFLAPLFPFIEEEKKVPPNTHHHLDLFHHTIETVRLIDEVAKDTLPEIQKHLKETDFGGFPRINHLKIAAFMHDIGKFSTWTIEENGRHRFIKHDEVGADLAETYLKELNFSKKQIEYITMMIRKHIYPSGVMSNGETNPKTMSRFVRSLKENSLDVIVLAMADRLAARGVEVTEEMVNTNINNLNILAKFYLENPQLLNPLPKLIDGNELMEILDLKPSKELGSIINALKEAQLNGEIICKEDALRFVKQFSLK